MRVNLEPPVSDGYVWALARTGLGTGPFFGAKAGKSSLLSAAYRKIQIPECPNIFVRAQARVRFITT